jgi:poly(glycerol-phosphate) alpha-glucosyltransferase
MHTIFQLTSWLSSKGGGIPPVMLSYWEEFHRRHLDCVVAGLKDSFGTPPLFPSQTIVFSGNIAGPNFFGYSPELERLLCKKIQIDSVVHIHGLWMYPGVLARRLANEANAVRIVSPHGMLEPWALNNSHWKKRIAGWCFEKLNLETASCLHALCMAEADNFKKYGLNKMVAVIPNGIDLKTFKNTPDRVELEGQFQALRGRRWLLFLSRIHPKKGLAHLLSAWAAVQKGASEKRKLEEWVLIIAGPDELGHETEMKHFSNVLGLGKNVVFTGPLHGRAKLAALGGAEAFALPSFSEGFSMAILEAAAAGLPVLLTPQCNFPELVKAGGAVEVTSDTAGCEAGLRQLLAFSDSERQAMGQRGHDLVACEYTWSRAAEQMLEVYRWLLNEGSKPECVI